jgi:hypothetical protein
MHQRGVWIESVYPDNQHGVLIFSTSATLQINNNTISNNDTSVTITAIIRPSAATMAGNRYNGIFLDQGTATINGNALRPMDVGVLVVAFTPADGTTGNSVSSMTSNTVTGATTGLQLLDSDLVAIRLSRF